MADKINMLGSVFDIELLCVMGGLLLTLLAIVVTGIAWLCGWRPELWINIR